MPTAELPPPRPLPVQSALLTWRSKCAAWGRIFWQLVRFGLVGCMNTLVDLLMLNCLLWLWPASHLALLLLANSLAYATGALNSFLLNRYWTFQRRGPVQWHEVTRFVATTLAGVVCNDAILCLCNSIPHPAHLNETVWTNMTKVAAISGTLLISYLGMRLWVFVQFPQQQPARTSRTRHGRLNAELLYKLKLTDCTVKEIGVRHLPRQGGKATGANPRVIARAFYELFLYARKWRQPAYLARLSSAHSTRLSSAESFLKDTTMPETEAINPLWDATKQRAEMPVRVRLALAAVMLTSLFLNFYQLGQHGFGNLFYAAGVRSMADNLHNFFFVAYDPGGFVTVDKPPLGFWLQTLSVKLLGFTPFSIFFPQALAGVLAVLVLFYLVSRHFGNRAGLLAALALALTPLSVATARNNTIDSVLVLILLLGAWATMLAAETGRLRWLLLSATLVGLGFNVKMMEAYLVVPAFGLLYLLAAPHRLRRRCGHLLLAALLLLAVSLSWASAVDLTPASQRPYVGSSPNNSEISLAFGYNGVDRLLGRFGWNNSGTKAEVDMPSSTSLDDSASVSASLASRGGAPPQGGRHGFGTDAPGPWRLFNQALGGQISWLLPLALLGILALAWQRRFHPRKDRQQQALVLWGVWLLTLGVFFSVAGFFHAYYMTTLAPAICALAGIGVVVMWQDYQRANWRGWLLPLALLATAAEQIHFILSNPAWGAWLIPLIASVCALVTLVLCGGRLLSRERYAVRRLWPALTLGLAVLLLTPVIWSAVPALQNTANRTPSAGPGPQNDFARDDAASASPSLLHYLEMQQGHTTFLVAAPSSQAANTLILATNRPVMAMGGFAGRDPILTPNQLAQMVAQNKVRFFLLNNPAQEATFAHGHIINSAQRAGAAFSWFTRNSQPALTNWIRQHCAVVPAKQWQANNNADASRLYDCATDR